MATGNKKSNFVLDIQTKAAEASIKRLKGEMTDLESKLKQLDSTSSKYTSTLKMYEKAEKSLNVEIRNHTKLVDQSIVSDKNSINVTQQKINALRKEMNAMDMSSSQFKQKSAQMRQYTASMLEGSSATGLHAASAMELGRVFSDAPYGIRGVANNISQLGSLMAQAATTTDAATGKAIGMTGALKGLWKSLMGPLGILLAFQAVVAAVEYFSGRVNEAEKELNTLAEATATGASNLAILKKAVDDGTISQEELARSVKAANGEYQDLNIQVDENGKFTQASADAIDNKIAAMRRLSKALAVQKLIEEQMALLIPLQAKADELELKAIRDEKIAVDALSKAYKENMGTAALARAQRARGASNENQEAQKEVEKEIQRLVDLANKEDLFDEMFKVPKSGGGGRKGIKDFKDKIFDLEKFILGLDKEMVISQEKNIRERLKLEQQYAEDELDLKRDSWIASQKLRRDNFIASAKNQSEIDDANNTFNKMVEQAEGEHMMALFKMKEKNVVDTKLMEEEIKRQYDLDSQKAALERASAELDLMNDLLDEKDPRALAVLQQKQRDVWDLEDAAFEEDMARKLIKLEQEGIGLEEREFLIDQERMARIADRNNAEVDMEIAKIESIKAVRMEYIGWLSSIGSTMKKLSKDNEGLAKAAVIVEKSAATAKVIASTQAANAEIMQESGAAASKSIVQGKAAQVAGGILSANPATAAMGAATSAAGAASIAAAAPIAASAKGRILKNNIGAGLAIANIWAESQGSSGDAGGSGGSGGGGNTFAPNFNVVGNSETNQLAESIGGQVNQPNRAYVVYEDIQNATELNANAVESSGI